MYECNNAEEYGMTTSNDETGIKARSELLSEAHVERLPAITEYSDQIRCLT